jgi:hypothetical protein
METVTAKQIHEEFDMASEVLYLAAKRNYVTDFYRTEKSDRLKKLGFIRSSEITEAVKKDKLPVYYRVKYPFLKFITEKQLEDICGKYGLIYAEVKYYTGDIPEKNLKEIENAKPLDEKDFPEVSGPIRENPIVIHSVEGHTKSDLFTNTEAESIDGMRSIERNIVRIRPHATLVDAISTLNPISLKKQPNTLFIAANKELFDLKIMENVKDTYGYQVKDPIVFRWCRGGLLIISKWGDEAGDPILTVPELN